MTEHTPGPWSVFPGDQPGIGGDPGNAVDMRFSIIIYGERDEDCGVRGKTQGQAQANAHLIAAAPDLLTACEALLEDFGMMSHTSIKLGSEAISKARGETDGS